MPQDMAGVLREFGRGQLHSGAPEGPVVKNRKQAVAIGLSEQRQQGKKDFLSKAFKGVGGH